MIDVALHLRDVPRVGADALQDRFRSHPLCPEGVLVSRLYVGDEFCANRLPSPDRMRRFSQWADETGFHITLLTPILSDAGIEAHAPLFDALSRWNPTAEVVANDWGVSRFLKDRHPHFRLAAGRLLDKGFKDPRAPANTGEGESGTLLSTGIFDQNPIREKMAHLGIARLERDLLPHRREPGFQNDRFGLSIYYPYGYFTTGRICWPASRRQGFVPGGSCDRTCETLSIRLNHPDFTLPVIQAGNTLFYQYSRDMLSSMPRIAERRDLRLVFQGWAIGDEDPASNDQAA